MRLHVLLFSCPTLKLPSSIDPLQNIKIQHFGKTLFLMSVQAKLLPHLMLLTFSCSLLLTWSHATYQAMFLSTLQTQHILGEFSSFSFFITTRYLPLHSKCMYVCKQILYIQTNTLLKNFTIMGWRWTTLRAPNPNMTGFIAHDKLIGRQISWATKPWS